VESGLRQEIFLQSIQTVCVFTSPLIEWVRQETSLVRAADHSHLLQSPRWVELHVYAPRSPITLHGVALNLSYELYFHFDSFPKTPISVGKCRFKLLLGSGNVSKEDQRRSFL